MRRRPRGGAPPVNRERPAGTSRPRADRPAAAFAPAFLAIRAASRAGGSYNRPSPALDAARQGSMPPDPPISNTRLVLWMFAFLRPVWPRVVLACGYLVGWIGAEILAVRQTAEAVNRIKFVRVAPEATGGLWSWIAGGAADAAALRQALLALAGLTVLLAVLAYLREVAAAKLSMHTVFHIRASVYDGLQRVGLSFHDRTSTGELINRALSDLQSVRAFVQSAVLLTLEIVLIVGGYILVVLSRSTLLAGLALLPLPIWIWYVLRFSRRVQPAQESVMEVGDKNISIITENLAGVHVVKAFATQRHEIDKYFRNSDEFFARVMRRIRMFADFTPVIRGVAMASHLSLLTTAGILIVYGRLLPGDILLLGSAMGAILGRLQQVAVINDQYQNAVVSARRLHEVLSSAPAVVEAPHAAAIPPGNGAVRFEAVTFGYHADRPVLHDVSFEAPGGAIVAIVGPTGAGKSTLVSLIARLYDPQRGVVRLDGVDLRDLRLSDVRTQVAVVFQETYLFSDTIEANIAYGRPGQNEADIEVAARLAQAHEFVTELPASYGTVLGERGTSLSGGQRQRLAIARALATNPRVLILDDATAAVDSETEDLIYRGMRFAMRGRTTFVIAHRVSTVKRADVVLVIERGRLVQVGTHAELINRPGYYRDVAAAQLYGDAVERPDESPDAVGRGPAAAPSQ